MTDDRKLNHAVSIFGFAALTIILLVLLAACDRKKETPFAAQDHPCDYFEKTAEELNFRIGIDPKFGPDPSLRLPREYVRRGSARQYRNATLDGAALIYLRYPDFAPITASELVSGVKVAERPFMNILFSRPADLPRGLIISAREKSMTTSDLYEALETITPNEHGLLYFKTAMRHELFASMTRHAMDAYLRCDPIFDQNSKIDASTVKNPQCSLFMNAHGLKLKIGFDRDYLANWGAISENATSFAACMTSGAEK